MDFRCNARRTGERFQVRSGSFLSFLGSVIGIVVGQGHAPSSGIYPWGLTTADLSYFEPKIPSTFADGRLS